MSDKVPDDYPYPTPQAPKTGYADCMIGQTLPGDPRSCSKYDIVLVAGHDACDEYIEGYYVSLTDQTSDCVVLSPGQIPYVIEFLQKAVIRGQAKKHATLEKRRTHTAQVSRTYVHVKTGKQYVVIAIEIDCDDNDGRERVAYVPVRPIGTNGSHVQRYSRSRSQFEDGRFVLASEFKYEDQAVKD
jgi:hypothetical protein